MDMLVEQKLVKSMRVCAQCIYSHLPCLAFSGKNPGRHAREDKLANFEKMHMAGLVTGLANQKDELARRPSKA